MCVCVCHGSDLFFCFSPMLRMSFIVFSSRGTTVMKLTENRQVVPTASIQKYPSSLPSSSEWPQDQNSELCLGQTRALSEIFSTIPNCKKTHKDFGSSINILFSALSEKGSTGLSVLYHSVLGRSCIFSWGFVYILTIPNYANKGYFCVTDLIPWADEQKTVWKSHSAIWSGSRSWTLYQQPTIPSAGALPHQAITLLFWTNFKQHTCQRWFAQLGDRCLKKKSLRLEQNSCNHLHKQILFSKKNKPTTKKHH